MIGVPTTARPELNLRWEKDELLGQVGAVKAYSVAVRETPIGQVHTFTVVGPGEMIVTWIEVSAEKAWRIRVSLPV